VCWRKKAFIISFPVIYCLLSKKNPEKTFRDYLYSLTNITYTNNPSGDFKIKKPEKKIICVQKLVHFYLIEGTKLMNYMTKTNNQLKIVPFKVRNKPAP